MSVSLIRKPRRRTLSVKRSGSTLSWAWHVPGVGRVLFVDVTETRGDWLASGRTHLWYAFFPTGKRNPLFSGDDFSVPAGQPSDSLKTALALLDFVCLRRGDTDAEYFADYTEAQLAWRDSAECEAAQLAVYELAHPSDGSPEPV